jgi:dGTPase
MAIPTREEFEAQEARILAPYAMKSAASRGRVHDEPEHPHRPAYQRDRERVIHSTAFRRLEYKTQVFVNHEGDHYRTRLTHTMEVAQIARAIARLLKANEDLTEAIALAHDLGHTPFGHAGEDALRDLMKDHGGFEHNRHGLRVVDLLESRYPRWRGLNLTWEVRESIAKHTSYYDHPKVRQFDPETRPLIEGQIVDMADSIAYVSHDLDDGLAAGMLDARIYAEIDLLAEARARVRELHGDGLPARALRSEVVRALINLLVTDLCEQTLRNVAAEKIRTPDDARAAAGYVVAFSPDLAARKEQVGAYLFEHVYRHYRVNRMSTKARRFIEEIFSIYAESPQQLPPFYQRWAKEQGLHQAVCDYVAGMTDRFAQDEYLRLFAPFERV